MNQIPSISRCDVFWHVPIRESSPSPVKVGTLVKDRENIYFGYDKAWLEHGIEISPQFLPLRIGERPISITHPESVGYIADSDLRNEFRGLPAPFYDSLPDRWGMRLLANFTNSEPEELGALDILCHRGPRCMGAFSYEPAGSIHSGEELDLPSLDLYCHQAAKIVAGAEPAGLEQSILDALEDSGGSAGGMRPKMLLAIKSGSHGEKETPVLRRLASYDHTDMAADFEPWLLKFDLHPEEYRGRIEQACAEMARAAGVILPQTTLISTKSPDGVQHSHFAVQRFDRELVDGKWHRVHMHTATGILQRDYNALDLDYTDLLELTRILTEDPEQVRQAYTRAVFNVLAGNSDDHAKNHAFLLDASGKWHISPAYDLTPSSLRLQPGIRSTSVLGDKREKIPLSSLLRLAEEHDVANPMEIVQQVSDATRRWGHFAKACGIPSPLLKRYGERMADLHPVELKATSVPKKSSTQARKTKEPPL